MHKIKIIAWFELSNTKLGSHHKLLNSTSHQNKFSAENCNAAAESLCRCCQLLALGVISLLFHHTPYRPIALAPGNSPPNQICVKQAASNLQSVQFQADLLHLLDQRQQSNPFSGGYLWSPWKRHPKKNYKLHYLYNCWALLQTPFRKTTKKSLLPKPSVLDRKSVV